jgi:hypothetical protein
MRAIKRSIAQARDEREARELHDRAREVRERMLLGIARSADASCEHVTRELVARIDTRIDTRIDARIDTRIETGEPALRADAQRTETGEFALRADAQRIETDAANETLVLDPWELVEIESRDDATFSETRETDTILDTVSHETREADTRVDARPPMRELNTRSEMRERPRRDIEPLRCEPCPRVLPARRLFDGSILQQFQCDGACLRDRTRARERDRAHTDQHTRWERARVASKQALRTQIAITTLLAAFAAMWIVLAVREASADRTRREDAETRTRRDDAETRTRRADADARTRRDDAETRTRRDDADARTRRDDAETRTRRDDAETRTRRVAEVDDDHAIDVAAPPTRDAPFGAPIVAPPIASVLDAAYRTAGLDHDLGRGFARRARLAGLVPMLSVRHGRDTSWRDADPNVSRGMTIDVRATWRLDRLVFDGRELQVAALDGARRRERRRLAARVIQVYFAWKRAAGAAGIQSRATALAEEAAAELDDLTSGWFSDEQGRLRGR